ncbi:proline racemase family protein [Edaphobacillus lindanitolerans]|uniref:Proline racemase n=1 Tax=Edaphobacillus lindanitolerans TaxID=550447 RepID=A0A1U7PI66_9BACI|nr:proline racemase family protein [Edaphobacillus lindanitolerans]SIT71928.1 proline racemase [Edaphobacillus lindanitolerans]
MKNNKMFSTVDVHVAGEPLRIITDGLPDIKGDTQLERRAYCIEHLDNIRKTLMLEPRGHHGMYGCIITPPAEEGSDFGVLFMHNEGWSTMCGHGIIGVVTMGIETGRFEMISKSRKFVIDSPAGRVVARAEFDSTNVRSVSFENVPSFVLEKELMLEVDGRSLNVDISFGGAFYVILDSAQLGLSVENADLPELQKWATKIKKEAERTVDVVHPLEPGLKGIYGVIYSDQPKKTTSTLRNVTVFADEQIDRSPCGTGTCARLASLHSHGQLKEGESFVHESITDGQFKGAILALTTVGEKNGVIPEVTGNGYLTGIHKFLLDPDDELLEGFLLEEV